jgi:cytochrome b
MESIMKVSTAIWDSFVRGYHWLQVLCIGGLWYTGTEGLMDWHFAIAYFLLTLLLTRIIWGFIGSDTARFLLFVRTPRAVIQYFQSMRKTKNDEVHLGHNPAGGYMVLGFFILLATQLITGLFANDDIISEGPLARYITGEESSLMTEIHALNFDVMLGAIVLHLVAIFFYLYKKDNLIKPMLNGRKETVTEIDTDAAPKMVNGLIGWIVFATIGSAVYSYLAKDIVAYLF